MMNVVLCLIQREIPSRAMFHGNLVELFLCLDKLIFYPYVWTGFFFLFSCKLMWLNHFCKELIMSKAAWWKIESHCRVQFNICKVVEKKSVWYFLKVPVGFSWGEVVLTSKCAFVPFAWHTWFVQLIFQITLANDKFLSNFPAFRFQCWR